MQIASGTVASFHYTLRGEDGAELENSHDGEPVAYLHGHGNILPALEEQLAGHAPGDTLAVTLAPEQAYPAPVVDLAGGRARALAAYAAGKA